MAPPKHVTIKYCANAFEASLLKGFLEGYGIQAWDNAKSMRSWTGRYSQLSRGIALRVAVNDEARARVLLEAPPEFNEEIDLEEAPDQDDAVLEQEAPESAPTMCPNCGSAHIHSVEEPWLWRAFLIILFVGLPLLGTKKRIWLCRDCDWDWEQDRAGSSISNSQE